VKPTQTGPENGSRWFRVDMRINQHSSPPLPPRRFAIREKCFLLDTKKFLINYVNFGAKLPKSKKRPISAFRNI
jgi:hypothetical protein